MYEALGNAIYTVTNAYIEKKGGVIWKTQHRIPLSYVRDVTYNQSFLQAVFRVSSVTVSTTNGNKIMLSNVPDGEMMRNHIWNLVVSQTPSKKEGYSSLASNSKQSPNQQHFTC